MSKRNHDTDYRRNYHRVLIDTQIPDWDPAFLSQFEPAAAMEAIKTTGAGAIMVYFQSHVGLCNWPTRSGVTHRAFANYDVVADVVAHAKQCNLSVCAYYSVNFNNWAYEAHPEWRLRPAAEAMIGGGLLQRPRYGLCCFNNPEYRSFVRVQAEEILRGYDVDAIFYDMMWWMSICLCDHCHDRYRDEAGCEIPTAIDWLNPDWCRFQAAREGWLTEFAIELRELSKTTRPELAVYHNFATGMTNWTRGVSFDSSCGHDFLGGDFYGGSNEQLVVSRLMMNLSRSRPVEFMTTVATNLAEHERLKPAGSLETQVFAATACSSAFLAITCFDPAGTLNPAMVERVQTAFGKTIPYTPYLGGEPVEDIAVYFSSESKMNFTDNGCVLADAPVNTPLEYPHFNAVRGACRLLQRMHMPFGIVTRKQIGDLHGYKVLILPNVLRMDGEEVAAVRKYVRDGGRLYASRYTSLTETHGIRHPDFMLHDLFGCHFETVETGATFYLKPVSPTLSAAIAPERYVSHWAEANEMAGAVRLAPDYEGNALATLSLPYRYPSRGSISGRDWSSIHSFPPWEHTGLPTIIENEVGRGKVIYSAADVETGPSVGHEQLFASLMRSLIGPDTSFSSDAHPGLWLTVFNQPEHRRWVVSLLNYGSDIPQLPLPPFEIELRAPAGNQFQELLALPTNRPFPATSTPLASYGRGSISLISLPCMLLSIPHEENKMERTSGDHVRRRESNMRISRTIITGITAAIVAAAVVAGSNSVEFIVPGNAPVLGPYSPATIAANLVFVSGQIGVDPDTGKLAGDDIVTQARQALDNLALILQAANSSKTDVTKVTVYLRHGGDFPAMNKVYAHFFGKHRPARTTVPGVGFGGGILVEIDAIAVRDGD